MADLLGLLLLVVGPLTASRQALRVLTRLKCRAPLRRFAPAPELGGAALAALGVSAAAGAGASFVAVPESAWATALPLIIAGGALYLRDLPRLRAGLEDQRAAAAAGAVLGIGCLLVSEAWAPRWRQVLVGCPSFFIGLSLQLRRLEEFAEHGDACGSADARPFLLFGLLGPVGDVRALAAAPTLGAGLAESVAAWALGCGLGASALALKARLGWGPKGLDHA